MTNSQTPSATPAKPHKKQGPIRWGAISFILIFSVLTYVYAHFFFDSHLRSALQWGGYKALGVQVDVADVTTSFFNLSLRIQGVDVTNRDNPMTNSVSIGDIRMALLWDGLLRAKFVMNEAAVEKIEFGKPRKSAGRVRPPEPPSNEPSKLAKEADRVKQIAMERIEQEGANNVFGDLISMLQGSSTEVQLQQFKDKLLSEKLAKNLEADLKAKQIAWQQRLQTLPKGKEFEDLGRRLGQVKTKDFKSLDELQKSIKEIESIVKEGDEKVKSIQSASNDLNGDLSKAQTQLKDLENQIRADVKSIESHFRIPQLDPKTLSRAIFQRYIGGYMQKAYEYRDVAEKYLPPKFTKKGTDEVDDTIQPHPRADGVTYEFGKQNSYPMVWIKRVSVSSQAGFSPYSGNIAGQITHITTNQRMIGHPTTVQLQGDFPQQQIHGFATKISLSNLKEQSEVLFDAAVGSYPVSGRTLLDTKDVDIAFQKASAQIDFKSKLVGLREFTFQMENLFKQIDFTTEASNALVDELIERAFRSLPAISLEAWGNGDLPTPSLNINSNLGPELTNAFGREIKAKIDETRARIEKQVRAEIDKNKAQIEAQIATIKNQIQGEIDKLRGQAESQKKLAENKTNEAKKDSENKAKKEVEQKGKEAVDDLKKRFGF